MALVYHRYAVSLIYIYQKDRIFDIADYTFTHVSDDEKRKYEGKMAETGSYQGYKLPKYWVRIPCPSLVDIRLKHCIAYRQRCSRQR